MKRKKPNPTPRAILVDSGEKLEDMYSIAGSGKRKFMSKTRLLTQEPQKKAPSLTELDAPAVISATPVLHPLTLPEKASFRRSWPAPYKPYSIGTPVPSLKASHASL